MKTCNLPDCNRPVEGNRIFCSGHRMRLKRSGSTDGPPIKDVPGRGISGFQVLLWNGWKVTESGCWEYEGPRFANGYGQVKVDGTPRLAHRLMYENTHGPIKSGLVIRHKCDNKPCIRPSHLESGTPQENVNDREERGRGARGIGGAGKFTDDQVRQIRLLGTGVKHMKRGKFYAEVAAEHNVHFSTIQKIVTGITYKYVRG